MNILRRAWGMLIDPRVEWAAIDREAGDPAYVLSHYVAVLAVVPALASLLGASAIGTVTPDGVLVRAAPVDGLFGAIFGYVLSCATVLALGLVIDLIAPLFGGRRDFDAAFKLAVYSFTAVWLAGLFLILPGLRFLILTGCYATYALWLGVPVMMKTPPRHALNFTAVIALVAFVLLYGAAAAQRLVFGTPGL